MKAKLASYSLCVCVMLATGSVFAQGSCSLNTFKGDYVFTDQGVLATVGWYASAGNLVANGDGTGTIVRETTSTLGLIVPKTTAFSYSLISGGGTSSTCAFTVNTADARSFDLYLGLSGKHGNFVATSGTVSVPVGILGTTVSIVGIAGVLDQE